MSETKSPGLDEPGLDLIFREARTQNAWLDKPVTDDQLRAIYELFKYGPTSANSSPARIIFVKTKEGKERLKPALSEGNLEKTMSAPVTAIIGHDVEFYEKLPELFPHDPTAKTWFNWSAAHAETTAFRNGTLQGAYFMIAARALGLDCGPMSGFDNARLDEIFFAGTTIKSNFICNLGYGDASVLFPRSPRLSFADACSIV